MNLPGLTKDEKREMFTEMLRKGEVTVTFTKVNGEQRVMPCTLSPSLIPVVTDFVPTIAEASEKKERKQNTDTMQVFCTDKKEWRSFRIDNVISIVAAE